LGEGQGAIRAHWSWVIDDRIRYKHDGEYEDHFRGLLIQAVKRRTAEKDAVLAELSGGMDSSSIVCVSDYIARQESEGSGELLDTVSYYDELESNWNERPYFTLVESRRGKVGVHLKTSFRDQDLSLDSFGYHSCWPGIYSTLSIREQQFEDAFGGNNYRVILSGVGGDEVLGGVPTALPELSDLVVKLRFTSFLERAVQYCLATRQPLLELVRTTIKHLYELYWKRGVSSNSPLWLNPRLAHHVSEVKIASAKRHPLRALPSTCGNVQMWWTLLATLPHRQPGFFARREYRYPYLDRDLVEYLMRVPRSQLARPGYRRSLMRRALRGIVPAEVLDRRRKASMITGPVVSLRHWEASICRSLDTSELKSLEFVEVEGFHKHLEMICRGTDVTGWPRIMQALSYECWLRATRRTSDEHQEHAQHVNFSVQVADVNELRA
jgi:asparagine synthase (glutamine-hydrolysing)